MDLSKLDKATNKTLEKARIDFTASLISQQSDVQLSSTIISLTLVLLEQLKREFIVFVKDVEEGKVIDQEQKSYSIVLKYINYWSFVSSLAEHTSSIRGDSQVIDRNHFYNVLVANNPHIYSIFINSLNSISAGEFPLTLYAVKETKQIKQTQ